MNIDPLEPCSLYFLNPYRIEGRNPRDNRLAWFADSNWTPAELDAARRRLRELREHRPDYSYRLIRIGFVELGV